MTGWLTAWLTGDLCARATASKQTNERSISHMKCWMLFNHLLDFSSLIVIVFFLFSFFSSARSRTGISFIMHPCAQKLLLFNASLASRWQTLLHKAIQPQCFIRATNYSVDKDGSQKKTFFFLPFIVINESLFCNAINLQEKINTRNL